MVQDAKTAAQSGRFKKIEALFCSDFDYCIHFAKSLIRQVAFDLMSICQCSDRWNLSVTKSTLDTIFPATTRLERAA